MTEETICTVTIELLPVLNGWRAAIYIDGELAKLGPTCSDRDMAMLYAKHMEDFAHNIAAAHT